MSKSVLLSCQPRCWNESCLCIDSPGFSGAVQHGSGFLGNGGMTAIAQEKARIFVVLNPMAGSCTADDVRQALDRQLGEQIQTEIYETTGDEDVVTLVRAELANNPSVVVAAGGDGTVSEVAEALIGTDTRLGIIPVGTANIFA